MCAFVKEKEPRNSIPPEGNINWEVAEDKVVGRAKVEMQRGVVQQLNESKCKKGFYFKTVTFLVVQFFILYNLIFEAVMKVQLYSPCHSRYN